MYSSKIIIFFSIIASFMTTCAQVQVADKETQISQALMAAPQGFRELAKVYGYGSDGSFMVLREGMELREGIINMVCLADDPSDEGFSVAAYYAELDPYMARGRALRSEGKSFKERFDILEEEVKAGELTIPDKSTLFVLSGDFGVDGSPENLYLRYVIYIPFATSESTGLPLAPASSGGPWIMNPGTHRAHIMINPPKN